MNPGTRLLIYGATGYTGRLLAHEAVARGVCPTLAGRKKAAVEALGQELGCKTRVFSLDDPRLVHVLAEFDCVLLAAGPFSRTSLRMLGA